MTLAQNIMHIYIYVYARKWYMDVKNVRLLHVGKHQHCSIMLYLWDKTTLTIALERQDKCTRCHTFFFTNLSYHLGS